MKARPYIWGPLDLKPLDALGRKAARLVGLEPDTYRAGSAVLDRAPAHIRAAWEAEEVSTRDAYEQLLLWEAGRLL